jgi:uncharacterized protein DUF11
MTDVVPINTTFVSDAQTSGPAFMLTNPAIGGTGTISGTIATLALGASASFTVVVRVSPSTPDGATVVNTAAVAAATADPNLANNSQTVTTDVLVPLTAVTPTSPTVVNVQRFGYHDQPTIVVVSFSGALDATLAQDVANYRIVTLGGRGRGGSLRGHVTRVRTARYNPVTDTVTLRLAQRLDIHNLYRITITGTVPGGLMGADGEPLDGAGIGTPGSNFVRLISAKTLAGRASQAVNAT